MNKKVYLDFVAGSTALGRIEIELFYDITPKTSENFRGLCTGEYGMGKINKKKLCYKGSKIHKIIEGQYIEGGDIIYGNGKGGESIYGPKFNDENFNRRHACGGLLSMANNGRNTNSSRFIITLKSCPFLDGKHVVFGQVISGMDTLKQIGKIPTDSLMRPKVKILILDCGDYDTRQIHLRKDVFQETLDNIVKDRVKREKIKTMTPEEAENFEYVKPKSEFMIEQTYDQEISQSKSSSEDEEEEEDYDDVDFKNFENGIKSKIISENARQNILDKFIELNSKINEAKNLNNKEVLNENNENLNENKEKKMSREQWKKKQDEHKNKMKAQGVPEDKSYVYESIKKNEAIKDYNHHKEKNKTFGWDVFNNEAKYRAYKKRLKNMPFDKDLYELQMKGENTPISEERKNLLKNDIENQILQREKFSRRRKFFDEEDVNYINERNRMYNKKLERFFGKEAAEIKTNLERGTAV